MVVDVWPMTLLFNRTSQNDWDVNDFDYHILWKLCDQASVDCLKECGTTRQRAFV